MSRSDFFWGVREVDDWTLEDIQQRTKLRTWKGLALAYIITYILDTNPPMNTAAAAAARSVTTEGRTPDWLVLAVPRDGNWRPQGRGHLRSWLCPCGDISQHPLASWAVIYLMTQPAAGRTAFKASELIAAGDGHILYSSSHSLLHYFPSSAWPWLPSSAIWSQGLIRRWLLIRPAYQ